jgi:hypothetical protein
MKRISAIFSLPVTAALLLIGVLACAWSVTLGPHDADYHRYDVTLSSALLSDCDVSGGANGDYNGQCHIQASVRFDDGSARAYFLTDGTGSDPTVDADHVPGPLEGEHLTLANFDLRDGQALEIWLKHRSDTVAYDYRPQTNTTVVIRAISFGLILVFGIATWLRVRPLLRRR